MKRFNASTVKSSTHLLALSEKQKARVRAARGIQMPFARTVGPIEIKPPNKDREFIAPIKSDYKPPKLRGASGTRLSPEKRAMVDRRRSMRAAFFASL